MVLAPIRYIAILPSDVITYDGSCSSSALPVVLEFVRLFYPKVASDNCLI